MNTKSLILTSCILMSFLLVNLASAANVIATPNPYTLTNTTIDVGQISVASTVISGGTGGYTGNWVIVPPSSANIATSNTVMSFLNGNTLTLKINATAANSLQFTFNSVNYFAKTIGTNTIEGTWTFNGYAQDSSGVNSVTVTNTLTIDPALSFTSFTASNTPNADTGQYELFSANWAGGASSYTANYVITNSITGTVIANQLYTNIVGTSNTFLWNIPAADAGNTIQANVIITDSASTPVTVNSVKTSAITLNPAPTATSFTPSNTILDSGQYVTYNTIINGGTLPITANIVLISNSIPIAINGATAVPGTTYNTIVLPTGSAEPNTITFNSLALTTSSSSGGAVTFNAVAIDSASTPVTFNAVESTITLDPALSFTSFTASNTPNADTGQYELFSANWAGGASSYTANYVITNSITGTVIANQLYTNIVGTSNTFLWNIPAADAGNTIQANVIITDHASTPVTVNSTKTSAITIDPALGTPSISPTAAQIIDAGQVIDFSTTVLGGTPNYKYVWTVYNSVTGSAVNTVTFSGVASTSNTFAFTTNSNLVGSTLDANVAVTDSAATQETTNSALSGIQTINSTLVAGAPTPTNPIVITGQTSVTLELHASGGVPPYTYQWYSGGSSTCTSDTAISGATATSFPTHTGDYYCYSVTDSATTPVTQYSSTTLVTAEAPSTGTGLVSQPTTTVPVTTTIPPIRVRPVINVSSRNVSVEINISKALPQEMNFTLDHVLILVIGNSNQPQKENMSLENLVNVKLQNVPANFSQVAAYNISAVNATLNVTLAYNCSINASRIVPYIYSNGIFSEIKPFSVNANACTVSFSVPGDPIVALLENNTVAATTTVPTTVATTIAYTTIPAYNTTPTTASQPAQSGNTLIIAIIVIIIIIVVAYLLLRSKKRRPQASSGKHF